MSRPKKTAKGSNRTTGTLYLTPDLEPDVFQERIVKWARILGDRTSKQEKTLLTARERHTVVELSIARNGKSYVIEGDCTTLEGRTGLLRWLEAVDASLNIFKGNKKR